MFVLSGHLFEAEERNKKTIKNLTKLNKNLTNWQSNKSKTIKQTNNNYYNNNKNKHAIIKIMQATKHKL